MDLKCKKDMLERAYVDLQYKHECLKNVPLMFNARLTRTVGRCDCVQSGFTGRIKVLRIIIATKYLEVNNYDHMLSILLHEVAHGIANYRYQRDCQHNGQWLQVCNEIGVPREFKDRYIPDFMNSIHD